MCESGPLHARKTADEHRASAGSPRGMASRTCTRNLHRVYDRVRPMRRSCRHAVPRDPGVWATARSVYRRGENASPAGIDGSSHHLCAHGQLAQEETTREDAELDFSKTDHTTCLLLSNSPAVSHLVKPGGLGVWHQFLVQRRGGKTASFLWGISRSPTSRCLYSPLHQKRPRARIT